MKKVLWWGIYFAGSAAIWSYLEKVTEKIETDTVIESVGEYVLKSTVSCTVAANIANLILQE